MKTALTSLRFGRDIDTAILTRLIRAVDTAWVDWRSVYLACGITDMRSNCETALSGSAASVNLTLLSPIICRRSIPVARMMTAGSCY